MEMGAIGVQLGAGMRVSGRVLLGARLDSGGDCLMARGVGAGGVERGRWTQGWVDQWVALISWQCCWQLEQDRPRVQYFLLSDPGSPILGVFGPYSRHALEPELVV